MKILQLFSSLIAAALIMPAPVAHAQSYTDVFGNYNYKGNLRNSDTTFLKRLVTGDGALDSSALAQFNSTGKGILVPRLTTAQKDSIKHPAEGLLVFDITVGCFFYYDDSTWVGMGACAGAFTSPITAVKTTTSVTYSLSDTEQTGIIIGRTPVNNGIILMDTTVNSGVSIGVGDYTRSIGTANTAAMAGFSGNNAGGFAVQPDSAKGFRVVAVSNVGKQQAVVMLDSSYLILYSTDSLSQSILQETPELISVSHRDSSTAPVNGIRAVSSGVDMIVGGKLVSFTRFADTLHRDMVFKVDNNNNAFIDYLHYTKDSFLVAGKLQVQDGTQGAGKILTSDTNGNASWQSPSPSGWSLNGNTGTNSTTNYIGTQDSTGLAFKTANKIFGYVDSVQRFNFNTVMDTDAYGIMTTTNGGGMGLHALFNGDESAGFGYYTVDARQFGFSKHLLLAGDPQNSHIIVDDSILMLQSSGGITFNTHEVDFFNGFDGNSNIVSDSCHANGQLIVGNSAIDNNTLSGGMSMGNNIILGGQSSITGNNLVGHGVINGLYPGLSENLIGGNSHIDSNYIEGAVLLWNLGRGADNSSWSHNYLKNLSTMVNLQDVSGQYNENVVGDTVTGDYSGIREVTLLGGDSVAFNTLSGPNSGIRDVLMHQCNLNYCKLSIPNAGVVASQFYNSNISHVNNQIYSSTFFNVNKNFSSDSTPWYQVMLINDKVGIGISTKPTADLQMGDNTKNGSFRYMDGNQGWGKVLTSDMDGNVSWQIPTGGGPVTAWKLSGNSGTNTSSNYIGTFDNNGLAFKTNGVTFGYIDSLQMFNFKTTFDSCTYGITTGSNIGGFGLNGLFTGDESARVGYYAFDGTPLGLSKHVLVSGDLQHTHLLRDDSIIYIQSVGTTRVRGKQNLQLEAVNGAMELTAPLITEFSPTILTNSISDSSMVSSNTVVGGAIFGGNTLSGGMVLGSNYLYDGGSSCVGNVLVGNSYSHNQGAGMILNEMHSASHLDSNYIIGSAEIWGVGKHSAFSTFSNNYLNNLNHKVIMYGISGESGEAVTNDSITGDYSGIYNLTLMSFDSVAYNVLSGANTNINNLIMQNSDLNYCRFLSPNRSFQFSQLFNSRIVNDTVNVVNCFFHNVNKDFGNETQSWNNIMLLNDHVGIGMVSKPAASLQIGDSSSPQTFRYMDGNQGAGKVLTSDSSGFATWQTFGGGGATQPAGQIAYGTGSGLTSDAFFTRDSAGGGVTIGSAFGADTFVFKSSANLIGSNIPGTGLLHKTPDGMSGFLAYNGTGIGDTRNDGQVGFFKDGGRRSAVVQWFFDSAAAASTLRLVAASDSGTTSMIKIDNYDGISFNSHYFFPSGHGSAHQVLTDDGTGHLGWQTPTGQLPDSTAYFTPGATDSIAPGDSVVISDTVAVMPYRYNIIDSTGSLSNLTISLPSSPVEGEWVEVKLAQSGVNVNYLNGAVANSAPAYIQASDLYIKLVFRASKNKWY